MHICAENISSINRARRVARGKLGLGVSVSRVTREAIRADRSAEAGHVIGERRGTRVLAFALAHAATRPDGAAGESLAENAREIDGARALTTHGARLRELLPLLPLPAAGERRFADRLYPTVYPGRARANRETSKSPIDRPDHLLPPRSEPRFKLEPVGRLSSDARIDATASIHDRAERRCSHVSSRFPRAAYIRRPSSDLENGRRQRHVR